MQVQDAVRRITIVANEQGLTQVDQKLKSIDRTYDQITAGSTRAATATEAAHRRMQRAMATFNAQGVGGFGSSRASAVGAVGAFAIANPAATVAGVAAVAAAYVALNKVWEHGSDLVERYANAQRDFDRSDLASNMAALTKYQKDTISADQVQYATELGARLADAKFTIDQFFKVHMDLTGPALKVQAAWVTIVEKIAAGTTKLNGMFELQPPDWLMKVLGAAATTTPIGAAFRAHSSAFNALAGDAPAGGDPLASATGRLAAALGTMNVDNGGPLGGSFAAQWNAVATALGKMLDDLAKKATDTANETRTAWDRATESLGKSIAMQEAERQGIGKTAGAMARLKTEAQLVETGLRSGMTEAAIKASEAYKQLGDRAEKAADGLARVRLQNELGFERGQFGRNDADREVATRLRGAGLPVDLEGENARGIYENMAMKERERQERDDPIAAHEKEMERLQTLLEKGKMDWETYSQAALKSQMNVAAGVFGMGSQLATALGGIFNEQKASAYAAAVLNTAESITKTMAQYGATPWGFAAAGVAAAAGAAQIAAISRQSRKGGSGAPTAGGAGGGGGTVAPAAAATPAPTPQAVNLKLVGKWHSTDSVRELIEQMNEYMKDGGTKVYVE